MSEAENHLGQPLKVCPDCHGRGRIKQYQSGGETRNYKPKGIGWEAVWHKCTKCKGAGVVVTAKARAKVVS